MKTDSTRKQVRASRVVARLIEQIEIAGNRPNDSAERKNFRLWYLAKLLRSLQFHIWGIESRLSWALFYSDNARMIRDTAFGRSLFIDSRLRAEQRWAGITGNQRRCAQVKTLQRKWNLIDKGHLAESEIGIDALTLLRKWYAYGLVANRLSPKRRVELERRMLEPIIRSLNSENDELFSAIAKACRFRKTDENNVDRRLAEFGALAKLLGKRNVGLAKTLMEQHAPYWPGEMRDFREKLTRCLVPWTRGKPGRPKKSGGSPKKKPLFS
jgi:hypothetical protein